MAAKIIAIAPAKAEPPPAPTMRPLVPTAAAIAAGHARGVDVSALFMALRQHLADMRSLLTEMIRMTPDGDENLAGLKTLRVALNRFVGETFLLAPAASLQVDP